MDASGVRHSVSCLMRALCCWLVYLCRRVLPTSWVAKSVKGQVALITGGGSGIGRLLACNLASLGCRVVIWDISEEGGAGTMKLAKKMGAEAAYFVCDVSNRDDVYRTAQLVKTRFGRVDILVNNAGMVVGKKLLDIPDEMIEKTFQVNSLAHFWTMKAFLPEMMESNSGHLVTISSLAGLQGLAQLTDYSASKFAAVGLYESISVELKASGYDGIQTTAICPFFINTGMFAGAESRVISFLQPEYVARRITDAILLNEDQVIIPGWLHYLFYMKLSFNYMTLYEIGNSLHLVDVMKTFRGRRS